MATHKNILIIGGGDHAKVLIDCALLLGLNVLGCLDNSKKTGDFVLGDIKILGDDAQIENFTPSEVLLVNGIGSTTHTHPRAVIFSFFLNKGFRFKTLIHPAAFVSPYATVKQGSSILAGAIISTNVLIGENVIINTKASIDHDCVIGDHTHIAPGATLSGNVTVEENVHIGTGASIIQNCMIANGSLIKAGQIVKQDIKCAQP